MEGGGGGDKSVTPLITYIQDLTKQSRGSFSAAIILIRAVPVSAPAAPETQGCPEEGGHHDHGHRHGGVGDHEAHVLYGEGPLLGQDLICEVLTVHECVCTKGGENE